MDGRNCFHRFDLDDYLIFHDDVGPESQLELNRTIGHGHWLLADLMETPAAKLQGENRLVDGLQETPPKRGMHTVG